MTQVNFVKELLFANGNKYCPIANISHIGNTINGGHYVTYSKSEQGQWWVLSDVNCRKVEFTETNNPSNYILLLNIKDGNIFTFTLKKLIEEKQQQQREC